jgi:hypothetical protein
MVRAGDRCKVGRYKREVLIALVSVLDVTPLAIIHAVMYMYSKRLKVRCLIGWPRLSKCIWGTCSFNSVYILRGKAVFLKNGVVV